VLVEPEHMTHYMALPVLPQSLTLLHLLVVEAALVQAAPILEMVEVVVAQTAIRLQ
jgi:hypothetical protein